MKIVNTAEYREIIKNGIVLVDFFANWCGPCKALAPVLEELSSAYPDIEFVKVDVDNEEDLAMEYGIMSIPAVFILKDGNVIHSIGGYRGKEEMKAFIDEALKMAA